MKFGWILKRTGEIGLGSFFMRYLEMLSEIYSDDNNTLVCIVCHEVIYQNAVVFSTGEGPVCDLCCESWQIADYEENKND